LQRTTPSTYQPISFPKPFRERGFWPSLHRYHLTGQESRVKAERFRPVKMSLKEGGATAESAERGAGYIFPSGSLNIGQSTSAWGNFLLTKVGCQLCGQAFTHKSNLLRHQRQVHGRETLKRGRPPIAASMENNYLDGE